jgi:hypothetical protein
VEQTGDGPPPLKRARQALARIGVICVVETERVTSLGDTA